MDRRGAGWMMRFDQCRLWVPGRPVPKGRARAGARGRVYTPVVTRRAEAEVVRLACEAWGRRPPLVAPVDVLVEVHCSAYRGDLDNIAKLVLDALQKAGVLRNDRDVWHLCVVRIEASRGREGTYVRAAHIGSVILPVGEG